MTTARVTAAIKRSVSHNEIVHIDACPADLQSLLLASDDSVEIRGDEGVVDLIEYWGTTDDGDEWRVHARPDGNLAEVAS